MRVLLINPFGFGDPSGSGVHVGLGYLASALTTHNCDVKVLDFENFHSNRKERLDAALNWKPTVIGITVTTFSVKDAINIISYCKNRYDCFYIAGGPHVTMDPENFMEKHKELFNCAVVGEGDETIVDVTNAVRRNASLTGIAGIIYYDRGKLVRTERELIEDLDSLPFPNYHVFDSLGKTIVTYPIITERGCPYHCVFCLSAHIWRRKWRVRTPENVLAEIKHAIKEYNIKNLSIWDDNFTLPSVYAKDRAKRICDLIIAENLGLNITLPNGVRADSIDEELLHKLKRAGCSFMMIGIEDVALKTIEKVQKGESRNDIKQAVKMIREAGIKVECSMVIGLIDATFKTTMESTQFLAELHIKGHWVIAVAFANTELYAWVKARGRTLIDVNEGINLSMAMYPPPVVFDTPEFTKNERIEAFKLANIKSGNYPFLYNDKEPMSRKVGRILSIAWKYDRAKFPEHLYTTTRRFIRELWIARIFGINAKNRGVQNK